MLGQPVSMLVPQVVGFKLKGALREGATSRRFPSIVSRTHGSSSATRSHSLHVTWRCF